MRQDGTRSYFFTADGLQALALRCGLEVVEMRHITRTIENKQKQIQMHRVWLHGRFRLR